MTINIQITCVRKRDRMNPHERIEGVGIMNPGYMYLTLDLAIRYALDETYHFWTAGGGTSVWVEVARHNGHPYLKTLPDQVQPDNLLKLPECPR